MDKVWTIVFNNEVDPSSINSDTIYIENSIGEKLDLIYEIVSEVSGDKVRLHLKSFSYAPDSDYTIYVKNVTSMNSKQLQEIYRKPFKTKSYISERVIIDLDDKSTREDLGMRTKGTLINPMSYNPDTNEYYTYIVIALE